MATKQVKIKIRTASEYDLLNPETTMAAVSGLTSTLSTINSNIAGKLDLSGGTMTGLITSTPGNAVPLFSFTGKNSVGAVTNNIRFGSAQGLGIAGATDQYEVGFLIESSGNPRKFFIKTTAGGAQLEVDYVNATQYKIGDVRKDANWDVAFAHSQAAHAPSNAQKNSDITKAEIEAVLTGAISTHTHLYAASASAGGAANSLLNFITTTTTTLGLDGNVTGIGYISGISLFGQTDGALYTHTYSSSWRHQIYADYRTGQIAIRGKNNNTWQAWRTVLDSSNYGTHITLTGLGIPNVTNDKQVVAAAGRTVGSIPTWANADGASLGNGYTVETTLVGGTGALARADAIKTYIDSLLAANDAMVYKGTIGTGGTVTALPTTHSAGWTYRVITAGTYAGVVCEVGDMITAVMNRAGSGNLNSDWTVFQTNIDGAVVGPASSTSGYVPTYSGVTGKLLAAGYDVLNSLSPSSLGTAASLVTEQDVYYGLVVVNNASQTRATTIYAPTAGGTAGHLLVAVGATSAPTWRAGVKGDVGLGNVDNTSDTNKPVSTAQQTALNLKLNLAGGDTTGKVRMYTSNTSGTYDTRAIELREVGLVTTDQSAAAYAPALAFHWGGRVQTQIALLSDGKLVVRGDAGNGSPILLDSDSTTTATANKLVKRDANGYIYGVYINSSRGNETSVAASYIYDTGDGWMRKKTLANAQAELVTKAHIESVLTGAITTHTHALPYYIEGNTTGTSGVWTGTHSEITEYYNGLTVVYHIGIAGASTDTLSINGLAAATVYRMYVSPSDNWKLTTHYPVGTVLTLTYKNGYWLTNSDYDSTDDYNMRWINNITAGATITRYKIIMQGVDGRYYPLTINDSTAEDGKVVSTQEFLLDGYILQYNSLGTTYTVGQQFGSYYLWSQQYNNNILNYTFNQLSGWTASMPIYLKGTIQANGTFKLDNTTLRSWLTQTLPTTDDGFVYIKLGYMHNTTTAWTLTVDHPIYHYKEGALRRYVPGHTHSITADTSIASGDKLVFADSSNFGKIEMMTDGINTTHGGAYLRRDGTWQVPPDNNTTYAQATSTTLGLIKINAQANTITTQAIPAEISKDNKQYAVQIDSGGMASVYVPWSDTNTWNANSLNVAGYVAAPGAVANHVWKTDASGNPAWRVDATGSDTLNTAGSTDIATKIFLVGASSQAASAQTYSDDEVFTTGGLFTARALGTSNTSNTTGTGISLYGGPSSGQPTYGLMFAGTATFGTHGGVTADWATYFNMNNTTGRGWIFKTGTGTVGNVASINTAGLATFASTVQATGFISTIAVGTAPLTVTSTTRVANLNAATSGTADQVANTLTIGSGLSGTSYNGSAAVTIAHSNIITASNFGDTGATRTLAFGGTFVIPYVTYDINGHVVTVANRTITMPANPNTNTTYTFATGTTNGTFNVTPSGGSLQAVSIYGLGSAAYTASGDYASLSSYSSHVTSFGNGGHVPSIGSAGQFLAHNGEWATPALPSHTHGDITNAGAITTDAVSPASGDYIPITDSSASNVLKRGIHIASAIPDGTYLANNGTWQTPSGALTVGSPGILLKPGSNQYISNATGNALTTKARVANTIDLSPIVLNFDASINGCAISVSTAATGTARVVVYNSDAVGRPSTVLAHGTEVSTGTTGTKAAMGLTATLTKGVLYYIGVWTSGAPTLRCVQSYSAMPIVWTTDATPAGQNCLRKTITYHATNSPGTWTYSTADHVTENPSLVLLRVA
jgi:hypothetical protein